MRSGFDCLAAWSAASPSLAVISFTSSPANVILTACCIVLESSARSRVLGMRAASTADAQAVQGYRHRGKLSREQEEGLPALFCGRGRGGLRTWLTFRTAEADVRSRYLGGRQ